MLVSFRPEFLFADAHHKTAVLLSPKSKHGAHPGLVFMSETVRGDPAVLNSRESNPCSRFEEYTCRYCVLPIFDTAWKGENSQTAVDNARGKILSILSWKVCFFNAAQTLPVRLGLPNSCENRTFTEINKIVKMLSVTFARSQTWLDF